MSYFEDNYYHLRFPLEGEDRPGFRVAQAGAIHALAAHFSIRAEPAIVTMPTGSGKTAVLIASAFVLRAKRVLVLTPSRLVREQIAEEVRGLTKLREIGAIPGDVANPSVKSLDKRVATVEGWNELVEFDVIVSTVQSISPEYANAAAPPADFFDLVLVDEAHHSPARTWKAILDVFPDAQRALFTATPFRQDDREIRGRFVFTYDLRKAYEDKIFGNISFRAVTPGIGQGHDFAIARGAEEQLQADRAQGYKHSLMVRTDSRKRAIELLDIYEQHTALHLKIVTGDKSLRYVKGVIKDLREGKLDGIVCVNMLGEGFDFPNLKVAAVHSPHRSLAVTLQFIGRFARTAGEDLGPATFLAIPSDIEIEAEKLYDSRAVWQELVQNLSAARVHEEADIREVLESFTPAGQNLPDLSDLSLYALEPYFHAKVYQLADAIDIGAEVTFPPSFQVIYRSTSDEHNAAIYITREMSLPRWTNDDRLAIVEPDLFIFHQDKATNLLFVCASRRAKGLYEEIVASFEEYAPRPLPLARLNRALNELKKTEFFNVGMRNRIASNTNESYRIITGSTADKSVQKSDGRLYHRGHFFGRAEDDGELITIGLSSASKIWSNKAGQLPELIEWFEKLARRIRSDHVPVTNSGLDFLSAGEEVSSLPEGIICAEWAAAAYRSPPLMRFNDKNGGAHEVSLIDLNIAVDREESDGETVALVFSYENMVEFRATFSFETNRFFEPASDNEPELLVESDRDNVPFIDYLNDEMLVFYTNDLAMLEGYNLFRAPDDLLPFDDGAFEAVDWTQGGVNIEREYGDAGPGRISVQQYLENDLAASDATIVYHDHGSGEIADFISIHPREDDEVLIRFHHCKGAGAPAPGHRVDDCYDVVGQAVKSIPWARWQKLESNVRRRFNTQKGSHRFIKGNLDDLETLFANTPAAKMKYEFVAVQPGLLKAGIPPQLSNLLAAASDYLVRGGFMPLKVVGS